MDTNRTSIEGQITEAAGAVHARAGQIEDVLEAAAIGADFIAPTGRVYTKNLRGNWKSDDAGPVDSHTLALNIANALTAAESEVAA